LARGDGRQLRMRMRQEQANEFFAGVTRRTDYGYLFGLHNKKTPPD
jgi:hypothetical protein